MNLIKHCDNLTMAQRWKPSANPGEATPSWVMWPSTIQPNLRAMLDLRVCVCVDLSCCAFAKAKNAKTMPVSAEPQCPNWFSKRYPAKPRHIESAVHACLSNALGGPANFCNSFGTLVFPTSVWFLWSCIPPFPFFCKWSVVSVISSLFQNGIYHIVLGQIYVFHNLSLWYITSIKLISISADPRLLQGSASEKKWTRARTRTRTRARTARKAQEQQWEQEEEARRRRRKKKKKNKSKNKRRRKKK